MIYSTEKTLQIIQKKIDLDGSVYFTRYGDGDIIHMSGTDLNGKKIDKNRADGGNGTKYTPQLEKDLQTTFKIEAPNYLKAVSLFWKSEPGMSKGLFEAFPYKDKLERKIRAFTARTDWLNPVVFHYLITFRPDLFDPFCDKYIKPLNKLYIGCVNPKSLEPIFGKSHSWIETIETNAVQQTDWIWEQTQKAIEKHKPDLIIPSCGQASRAITGRLWKAKYEGSVIDFGSLVDVFGGRASRTWIKLKGDEILKRYGH